MCGLILVFTILQIVLFLLMTVHDWVHFPPLTNMHALEKSISKVGRLINSIFLGFVIFVPLALTWIYQFRFPWWALIVIVSFYVFLTIGTIVTWWFPYFFGWTTAHKSFFEAHKNTHHFLPKRGSNVMPNTFHVILHVLLWVCCAIAIYILCNYAQ